MKYRSYVSRYEKSDEDHFWGGGAMTKRPFPFADVAPPHWLAELAVTCIHAKGVMFTSCACFFLSTTIHHLPSLLYYSPPWVIARTRTKQNVDLGYHEASTPRRRDAADDC